MKNFEVNTETMEIKLNDDIPSAAADHILNRFENYYELNGLVEDWISSDAGEKNRSIFLVWDKTCKCPTAEEFEENLERWYDEFQSAVKEAVNETEV